ncbi:AbfB domain-containing protein, partial [Saccharothrix sp. MB29]|nr:AbfB domain-containing protein [Saccharothrix sp. MB29]
VQKVHWNDDGTPGFGVPVGEGGPVVRLSPVDSPRLVVRHRDYRLRVDGDVRELGDSQFRLVDGFLGADTTAVQSVNFPDRYARVDGVSLRVDPYEDSDAYGRTASFVRVAGLAGRDGVSLRLAADPARYVAHDGVGRLVLTAPGNDRGARERATFRLG